MMARATFWDLYYDRDGTFSSETRQKIYTQHQTELANRFLKEKAERESSFEMSSAQRITYRWQKPSEKEFYVYATQIHADIELDYVLLQSLINNTSLFAQLPPELQERIRYYYNDYASLLLDEASIPNNRADMETYRKVLAPYQPQINPIEKPTKAKPKNMSMLERLTSWFNAMKAWLLLYPETVIFAFGFLNIYRLLSTFFRLTWLGIWGFGHVDGWFDSWDQLVGKLPVNTHILVAPVVVFNVLSVLLFLGRFVVDFGMLLKHVFLPTDAEEGVNYVERARIEWRKRYGRMVNDVLWALFNLLTNYAVVFGISTPIVGWLLMAFLVFDVYWYGYKWYQAEKQLAAKHSVLSAVQQQDGADKNVIWMVQLQLRQLEARRVKIRAEFLCNAVAAAMLVISIGLLSAFAASPLAMPICFSFCALAVAMYLTADQFGTVIQARHERHLDETKFGLPDLKHNPEYAKYRRQAELNAWKNFGLDFAEALVVPAILIGLFTVCWPAAVALTLAYVAFKIAMKNENVKEFTHKKWQALTSIFGSTAKMSGAAKKDDLLVSSEIASNEGELDETNEHVGERSALLVANV